MKRIVFLLVLFVLPSLLFSQKTERFCIVRIFYNAGDDEIYVSADSGQVKINETWYLADSSHKKRNFKTEAGALNYIGSLGWKLVPLKPELVTVGMSKGQYLFKKEE